VNCTASAKLPAAVVVTAGPPVLGTTGVVAPTVADAASAWGAGADASAADALMDAAARATTNAARVE
jgi:hypothetical protein